MVFSSILFLFVFLPVFLIVYNLIRREYRNYVILLFSILFYSWGAPKFVFLLLASLLVNYYVVAQIHKSKQKKSRQKYLIISLVINLGLLAYFKYANFFVDNVNHLLSTAGFQSLYWVNVALPIGISFFTFQSLTYTIDVYRKIHEPLRKISDYFLYILMFPQLIAGPIVRFNTIADDIIDRKGSDNNKNRLVGITRFSIGLAKKVLISNILGEEADRIFSLSHEEMDSITAWVGVIAYSFQIYFDFSGYSDMAIGLGKMIGFNFPENFNNPYISQSITEFWRRWHITLGQWMKDYLYIPLGGNRVSASRIYFNLAVVFLLSGLWHGASWNFVIWGAWHGLFLIMDRLFLVKLLRSAGKFTRIILTYFIVLVGWVFFRIESFNEAMHHLGSMFAFDFEIQALSMDNRFITILILAVFFSFITIHKKGKQLEYLLYYKDLKGMGRFIMFLFSILLLLLSASFVTAEGFNPFIYFRF